MNIILEFLGKKNFFYSKKVQKGSKISLKILEKKMVIIFLLSYNNLVEVS